MRPLTAAVAGGVAAAGFVAYRHRPAALTVTIILSEFGDFFMMRRMLYDTRRGAENGVTRDLARDTPSGESPICRRSVSRCFS